MAPRYAPPPKAGPERLGQAEYDRQMAAHRAWLESVAGTPEPTPEEQTVTRTRAVRDGDVATFAYTAKIVQGGRTREVKVRVEAADKAEAMAKARAEVRANFPDAKITDQRCNRPRGVPFQKGGDDRQVQHVGAQAGGKGGASKAETASSGEGAEGDENLDGDADGEGDGEGDDGRTPLNGDTPGGADDDAEGADDDAEGADDDAEGADDDADEGASKGKGAEGDQREQEAQSLEQVAQSLKAQQKAQQGTQSPKQAEAECDLILLRKSAPPAEGAAAAVLIGGIAASVTKPVLDGMLGSVATLTDLTKAGFASRPTKAEVQEQVAGLVHAAVKGAAKDLRVDGASLKRQIDAALSTAKHDTSKLEGLVARLVAEATKPLQRTVELVVKREGAVVQTVSGAHTALRAVIQRITMRDNVALIGPTGCGKTHLAMQLGAVLGRPVYVQSLSGGLSESALTGRYLPVTVDGKWGFMTTRFIDLFENGGVYVGDEMDGADPNVLLVLNSALANGVIGLPNRHAAPEARRHPDFVFVGTFNTWGAGSNRMYVGRNAIDGATMDRFRTGTVEMDYDRALERSLVQGTGSDEYLDRLWAIRDAVNTHRIPQNVSTRFVVKAWEYRTTVDPTTGKPMWTQAEVEQALLAGWTTTERSKVPARKEAA